MLSRKIQRETLNYHKHFCDRNFQVQVIIPYTSDYTPLPFQPSHNKQTADLDKSNHDNYVVEESKHEFNVVRPPSSTFQPWLTLPIFEGTTRKSVDTKANNSIDVHKLQKNIDNWTIQVCYVFL